MRPGVDFYEVVLALHIIGVVVAFGAFLAYPFMEMAVRKGRQSDLPAVHRLQLFLTNRLVQPAMAVVLVAGLYLAQDSDTLSEAWVSIPFAILIALFGLMGALVAPSQRKAAELAERDLGAGGAALSDEYRKVAARLSVVLPVSAVLIMLAIFVMTTKPGA